MRRPAAAIACWTWLAFGAACRPSTDAIPPADSDSGVDPATVSPATTMADRLATLTDDPRLLSADLERGEILSFACQACHTLGAGQPVVIGPNLHGVFGRRAATREGFEYSPALAGSGIVWTTEALEDWLASPTDFVPDTKMVFAGYGDPNDRRDLIAYLLVATAAPVEP